MKHFLLATLSILPWTTHAQGNTPSPLAVVEARMEALNTHQLEAFLNLYADDVEISVHSGPVLTVGKKDLAGIFASLIEAQDVHVEIHGVLAAESFVVVDRTVSYGDVSEPGLAVYRVQDGLITHVQFLRDTRRAKRVGRQRAGE